MCSFLLGQHNNVDRFVGLTYSYPYRRQVPVFGALGKSCAVDNDDLPPAAAVSKNAERCVLITALCQLTKPPVEFLSRSVSAIARNLKHCAQWLADPSVLLLSRKTAYHRMQGVQPHHAEAAPRQVELLAPC